MEVLKRPAPRNENSGDSICHRQTQQPQPRKQTRDYETPVDAGRRFTRVKGIASVTIFGKGQYAMRISASTLAIFDSLSCDLFVRRMMWVTHEHANPAHSISPGRDRQWDLELS